jgi:hypothetical protein
MLAICRCALPQDALLLRYLRAGAYVDCHCNDVARDVSHAGFVEAFYTTALFKVERRLLSWSVARPSAAWNVEARRTEAQ